MVYNYNEALNSGGRSVATSTVPGGAGNAFGYHAKIGVSYLASQGTDLFDEGSYPGNARASFGA
jgi:hypothetical protein